MKKLLLGLLVLGSFSTFGYDNFSASGTNHSAKIKTGHYYRDGAGCMLVVAQSHDKLKLFVQVFSSNRSNNLCAQNGARFTYTKTVGQNERLFLETNSTKQNNWVRAIGSSGLLLADSSKELRKGHGYLYVLRD